MQMLFGTLIVHCSSIEHPKPNNEANCWQLRGIIIIIIEGEKTINCWFQSQNEIQRCEWKKLIQMINDEDEDEETHIHFQLS